MAFSYTRPTRLYLTHESQKVAQSMRRRPLHKNERINFKEKENEERKNEDVKKEEIKNESSDEKGSSNDSKESIDTSDGGASNKIIGGARLDKRKLNKIVKKLSDRMASKLALNGNGANGHHHASTAVIPTSYSLVSHIANSINSQSPHQHVSPRKRILRELEKVSLEDSKRSRPKSITTNGNMTHFPPHQQLQQSPMVNGSLKNEKAPPTVSRPISSYSITSLLAHNTSSSNNNNNNNNSISLTHNSNNNNNINNDSITSHQSYQQTSRLNSPPKSPTMLMQNSKRKSPNTTPPGANIGSNLQSPIQSPSPEHHAFHKYRPIATTPTSTSSITAPASSSSPYNSSYHSPSYMRGSPSPSEALNSRLRTTGNIQQSPSRYGTSSPSNYGTTPRDSSLSPNVVEKISNRSTPTTPGTSSIRTVPKKTAALRQQFSSPTMNESSSSTSSSSNNNNNNNKIKASPSNGSSAAAKCDMKMDVDSLLRPSTLIAPPPIPSLSHPAAAAALSHYPYMYLNTSPLNYIPPPHAVPPYYHPFYNPAMMAAAAAAYRFPIPGYPSHPHSHMSSVANTMTTTQTTISSPSSSLYASDKSNSGPQQQTNLPSPYIAASPWNPIPLTNHSINDGNIIPKVKDEPSSGKLYDDDNHF